MNDQEYINLLKSFGYWCVGLIIGLLLFIFGAARTGYNSLSKRVKSLEDTTVTRTEFLNAMANLDVKQEKQHGQNVNLLEKIDRKMDEYEKRSSDTRHATSNMVMGLSKEVAVIKALQEHVLPKVNLPGDK